MAGKGRPHREPCPRCEALVAALGPEHPGPPPTYRELAEVLGTVTSVVAHHLDHLEEIGRVKKIPGIARGLALTEN
jgi:DNA-binding MarR family transcriptional regulator